MVAQTCIGLAFVVLGGWVSGDESGDPNSGVSPENRQRGADPIRVLLLTGQNNHNWRATTPQLQSILEEGGFSVDIEYHPERLTSRRLQNVDVILSNWNTYGGSRPPNAAWSETLKHTYLSFVRQGGGHVVVHAGSSSFPDWTPYHEMTLATWKVGQTGHGPQHDFRVRIDASDHPITRGMKDFTIHDELWHRTAVQKDSTILASAFSSPEHRGTGQIEPIALAHNYGEGRSFTLLLGHAAEQMSTPGFKTFLIRGTAWAAGENHADTQTSDSQPMPVPNREQQ
ncbi:ThuA domain-containing protein [Rhodopirellula sallentina]|uniref:ThuA domain-containing protein n=1 Tax=Rhodopirellula sallentina TaxID=1263869 RepID=UPI00034DDD06|nr:ThuA domain-containing protein [Rhodopirellula sallentina]